MCIHTCKYVKHYQLYEACCFIQMIFQPCIRETANHCRDLTGSLNNHYATTYGLHRDSSLNSLLYFHVNEGLIPDVMHDCLEGCIQYEVKELCKHLCAGGILSLATINSAIQTFPLLEFDARNRPAPITAASLGSSDLTLKQTG